MGRKFKIAVSAGVKDRAVLKAHDLAVRVVRNEAGDVGYQILVGGGLGRTPMIGKVLHDFLPRADLLPYIEAVVSVWNQIGRRDNKYKARIKITVHEHGIDDIRARVDERFALVRPTFDGIDQELFAEIQAHFAAPEFNTRSTEAFDTKYKNDVLFRSWADTNLHEHRADGYAIVTISTKKQGATPGDATADQMRTMAELARNFGHDELRISHEQNVILPHVHKSDLPAVYAALREADLHTANIGLISDIIACPGMDYCALATARSIPVAQQIATRFDELKLEHDIGHLQIKISGCINACGHHHVAHIGILGLDRAGVENYQITLGGDATWNAAIGERAGPGFAYDEIVPAIERLVQGYLNLRDNSDETFIDAYRRLGLAPFKAYLYPEAQANAA
jgi:sulfite reductase (NADPH) hemoprotein beta-component